MKMVLEGMLEVLTSFTWEGDSHSKTKIAIGHFFSFFFFFFFAEKALG